MNIFVTIALAIAAVFFFFITVGMVIELYFHRKEKYFLFQIKTIGAVLEKAAGDMKNKIKV